MWVGAMASSRADMRGRRLFETHPDLVSVLCTDAPNLVEDLLDGSASICAGSAFIYAGSAPIFAGNAAVYAGSAAIDAGSAALWRSGASLFRGHATLDTAALSDGWWRWMTGVFLRGVAGVFLRWIAGAFPKWVAGVLTWMSAAGHRLMWHSQTVLNGRLRVNYFIKDLYGNPGNIKTRHREIIQQKPRSPCTLFRVLDFSVLPL